MTLGEVKRYLNKVVVYDGDEYVFKACRLFLDEIHHEFKYSAELASVKTRCLICVPLEKVEKKDDFYE